MMKVLNIMNRTYCNKCYKQRITISHLENYHNEVIPKFNIEEDIKSIMRPNNNQDNKENSGITDEYKQIYEIIKIYT